MDTHIVISLIGIIVSIVVMIFLAYRGVGIYVYTILAAMIVIAFSGQPFISALTENFMTGFTSFAKNYFLLLGLSATFAQLMGVSGAARRIAQTILKLAGKNEDNQSWFRPMFCIMMIPFFMTLGGISTFIVVFLVADIARNIYQKLDIPWHMYFCGSWASATMTMTMIPGTPSIQNIIPTNYLGTTTTAAPFLGIISAVICLILEICYIQRQIRKAKKRDEHFLPSGVEYRKMTEQDNPPEDISFFKAILPSVFLLVMLNVPAFGRSPIQALLVANVACMILFYKHFTLKRIASALQTGVENSSKAVIGTSCIVGFGSCVSATAGYAAIVTSLNNLTVNPLIQIVIVTNVLAGITGSSSGGLTMCLNDFAERFIQSGVNPQIIHRIAAIASGGLDSVPHSSAVNIGLQITGLNHNNAYRHFFWCCTAIPLIVLMIAVILASMGVC